MEAIHEIINFKRALPVRCYLHKLGASDRHWHESLELLMVLSGSVRVSLQDNAYTLHAEDLLLINCNEIHELRGDSCVLIALQIKPSLFENELPDAKNLCFSCNSTVEKNNEGYERIRTLIARLVKSSDSDSANNPLLMKALIYQLAYVLMSRFLSESSNLRNSFSRKNIERVTEIAEIIDRDYRESITLTSLAAQVHLSVPYLSRFFEKQMGTTFLSYLNSIRLTHAVNDLLSTDYSIEQIAADNGFSSAHSFVQIFKKNYECLPSVYRRRHRDERRDLTPSTGREFTSYLEMEQYDYMATLGKYIHRQHGDSDHYTTTVEQQIDVSEHSDIRSLRHTWKVFATVWSAKQLLYRSTQDMLRTLQDEIGFQYLKFHGILSDEMHVYHVLKDKGVYYSFALVDDALDFVLSLGLKPMIQLSFMPKALALDPKKYCYGFLTSPPKDIGEWTKLVRAFTLHLLDRYGETEVLSWPFTVWNEPDTNYKMFGFQTDEAFYPFYQATYRAVKECNPNIRFGSPSNYYLTEYRNHWIVLFLDWCKKHGCTPDFLNEHFYNTAFREPLLKDFEAPEFHHKIGLSEEPNLFHTFVNQITGIAEAQSPALPVYLTEWNCNPAHSDLLNDTCFLSCFVVKNLLENYDRLESFGYWTLSDFTEESPIQPMTFQGGMGLFTYNGIKKPVYYAFRLLNRLGDELVARGEGWFLTRRGESYQLMVYRYKHFSSLYARGEMFDMTHTFRYSTFSADEQSACTFRIPDMPYKEYLATETSISRHSGSSFDKWVEMGAIEPGTREELSALQNLSVPGYSKYICRTREHTLELSLLIEQLEVKLLELVPCR